SSDVCSSDLRSPLTPTLSLGRGSLWPRKENLRGIRRLSDIAMRSDANGGIVLGTRACRQQRESTEALLLFDDHTASHSLAGVAGWLGLVVIRIGVDDHRGA